MKGRWAWIRRRSPLILSQNPAAPKTPWSSDTDDLDELRQWLLQQAERVGRELRQDNLKGRTVTLKIKFADFKQITRSHTLARPSSSTQQIYHLAEKLLLETKLKTRVRLVGLSISQLTRTVRQENLFFQAGDLRQEQLDQAVDRIQGKFGFRAICRGKVEKEGE